MWLSGRHDDTPLEQCEDGRFKDRMAWFTLLLCLLHPDAALILAVSAYRGSRLEWRSGRPTDSDPSIGLQIGLLPLLSGARPIRVFNGVTVDRQGCTYTNPTAHEKGTPVIVLSDGGCPARL